MPEYIEREALMNELKAEHEFIMNHPEIVNQSKWREAICYNRTLKALYNQPTANVVEVRHGKWDFVQLDDCIICSECKSSWNVLDNCTETFNYCPNCGAKMDGKGGCDE